MLKYFRRTSNLRKFLQRKFHIMKISRFTVCTCTYSHKLLHSFTVCICLPKLLSHIKSWTRSARKLLQKYVLLQYVTYNTIKNFCSTFCKTHNLIAIEILKSCCVVDMLHVHIDLNSLVTET